MHEVVYLAKEVAMTLPGQSSFAVGIEFAFQFTDGAHSNILSYVNTVETTSGGTHLAAMKASILCALNEADLYPLDNENDEAELTWKRVAPRLSAVINIRHPNPHFRSPTKAVLGNREIYGAVAGLVYNSFWEQLQGMGWEKRKAFGRHFFHPYTSNSDDSVV
ncbi:MAG: hypothetical protein HY862_17540 [Chloroflexi bacterium]|nr:hypothetical protein [Chloroflexota bacterium]